MGFFNQQEQGKPIAIKDEGITIASNVGSIDFTGAGVTGSAIGSDVTEDIPGGGGGGTWGSITGIITDQTDLVNYIGAGYVPYTGAIQSIDLNGYDLTNVNNVAAGNSVLAPIFYIGSGSPTGYIQSVGSDFGMGAYGYYDFVGWNSTNQFPYFGSDPGTAGYGMQWNGSSFDMYSNGGAEALGFTLNGGQTINGNSNVYVTPLFVNDASVLSDDSTDSFAVYASDSGTYGIQVRNAGSVLMANSTYQFLNSGDVYLGSNFNLNSSGQLRMGGGAPLYAQLESISTTQTHLRLGYNDTYYVQENVSSLGGMTWRPNVNASLGYVFQNSSGSSLYTIDSINGLHYFTAGANTFLLAKGASNITPNLSIAASGGKAAALLVGSSGATYTYDSTGTFNIMSDTRANIVAGTSSGGTARITVGTNFNVAILASSGATNTTPVDYLQVGDPAGVNQSFGASELRVRFGTSNRATISQNLTANGSSSGGLAAGDGSTYAYYGARSGRAVINAGTGLGFALGAQNATNWGAITPVQYSTGTASQSGTTVTGVGTTWTASMVGSEFVYADGTSSGIITAFGSTTSLTVTTSQTVGSQNYRINYPAIEVTSSGKVGINTASSLTAALTVAGMTELRETSPGSNLLSLKDAAGTTFWNTYLVSGDLRFYDTVAALDRLVIQDVTGNVVIGGTSGSNKLSILQTSSTTPNVLIQDLGSGDAGLAFNVSGTSFTFGIDQSDSSKFKLSNSTTLGTADILSIVGSTGAITLKDAASIGSSSANQIYNASTATTVIDYNINASSTANNTFIRFGNGTLTSASSGVSNIISSTPSINQSGTAGYTAININVTETGTGSGAKNLAKWAVGGVDRFTVTNTGTTTASAFVSGTGASGSPSYSFTGGLTSGFYLDTGTSPQTIYVQTSGNNAFRFNSNTNISYAPIFGLNTKTFLLRADSGAVGSPTYAFDNDSNTGMWSSGADTLNFVTNGTNALTISSTGAASFNNVVRLKGYTVATLPAGTQGDTAFASDLLAPTFGATAVGGGAVVLPVFFDGTNWKVY